MSFVAPNSFSADVHPDASFCNVGDFHLPLVIHVPVNFVTVHLGEYEAAIVRDVHLASLDGFDRARTTTEYT